MVTIQIVKGMIDMNYAYTIPHYLYEKPIYSYLETLIDNGLHVYDLDEEEREDLVVRIIQVLGTDAYNVIIGSDDFDKTLNYFSKFLQTADPSDLYDLGCQMRDNALDHYNYDLEQLFNEILETKTRGQIA
jgi:hypothetical protein